ncbi:MAG: UbiA family prenyltransferase [Syntrophotaleaceae bacterium]
MGNFITTSLAPLIRVRIALAVTCAALAGFVLAPGAFPTSRAALLAWGVFLLAASGSILNQFQERQSDALMERTRQRPMASGRMNRFVALIWGLIAGSGGIVILLLLDRKAAVAGLLALLFYNALYTPLKKRSFLALLPGALCGSMAPAIGWLSAGGRPEDYRMVLLCGLLLLWQIPHFWLFALENRDDLERANLFPGLPTAPRNYARALILVWIFALLAGTLLLPALKVVPLLPTGMLLLLVAAGLTIRKIQIRNRQMESS